MALDRDILMRLQARDEDLHRALTRSQGEVDKLKGKLKELKDAGKESTQESARGFQAVGGAIESVVLKLAALTGGLATVKRLMDDVRKTADEATARTAGVEQTTRGIYGIELDPAQQRRILGIRDRLRGSPFGFTAEEATRTAREAAEKGVLDDALLFAQLRNIGVDPVAGMEAVQKVGAAYGPQAGTSREIINKLLEGSRRAPGGMTDIARAISVVTATGSMAGVSDQQLLAMVGELAIPMKTADIAADRVKELFSRIERVRPDLPRELRDTPAYDLAFQMDDMVREGRMRMGGKRVRTMFDLYGSVQAVEASTMLNTLEPQIKAVEERIRRAGQETGAGDLFATALAGAERDRPLTAARAARVETQRRQMLEERQLAEPGALATAVVESRQRAMREGGAGELRIALEGVINAMNRWLVGDTNFLRAASDERATGGIQRFAPGLSPEIARQVEEAVYRGTKRAVDEGGAVKQRPTLAPLNREVPQMPARSSFGESGFANF